MADAGESSHGPLMKVLRSKKRRNSGSDVDSIDSSSDELEGFRVRFWSVRQKKSKRFLSVSASFVSLISLSKYKNDNEDCGKAPRSPSHQSSASSYEASSVLTPKPSPAKRRLQVSWLDSVRASNRNSSLSALSHTDIKRQEAIYELYQGEKDMVDDLNTLTKLYRDSLITLGLMSQAEVNTLFGNIDSLFPVHQDLLQKLQGARKADGTTQNVGKLIHEWTTSLSVYVKYCANQIKAKSLFDEKKNDPAVDDFFRRCLTSPCSRKLDLWTLLDGARSQFVKYPLLFRSILKNTPCDSEDAVHLEASIKLMESIIREADEQIGNAQCEQSKSALYFLYDEQKIPEIEESRTLVCSGCMKNVKGNKLHLFLFDKVAVVTRLSSQGGRQGYQVYRQPIPVTELVVEDLPDGEVKLGSFRSAFSQGGQTAKNLIRISFKDSTKGQSHTIIANDEHDKRKWMQAFHKIVAKIITVVGESKKEKLLSS